MVEESDGIEDALEGQLRVLITAAGQVAERVTRAREDALRRARAGSEHEARAVQSRLAAEQAAPASNWATSTARTGGNRPARNRSGTPIRSPAPGRPTTPKRDAPSSASETNCAPATASTSTMPVPTRRPCVTPSNKPNTTASSPPHAMIEPLRTPRRSSS